MSFFPVRDLPLKKLAAGVDLRILHGESLTVGFFTIAQGAAVPEHAHPHEQVGTVLAGEMELDIAGEKKAVGPGHAYHIPSGALHSGTCLKGPAEVIEVFAPAREDWR
jgi:quercetin dioxygenase-like cupin family protein